MSEKETYSLVTAESLCCGTPVFGFKCGGAEEIDENGYNKFVEYGDVDSLIKLISSFNPCSINKETISINTSKYIDNNVMCEEYYSEYKKLVK